MEPCWVCGRRARVIPIEGTAHGRAECRSCGAIYVTPPLSEAEAATLYASDMQWTAPAGRTYDNVNFGDAFRAIEAELRSRLGRPGRVLDVGCHTGRFLECLREAGWDCVGLDPNTEAIAVCHDRGFTAYANTLDDLPPAIGVFDAVTMLNTLGCLVDPREALREAHGLLRPGGILVIQDPNTAFHVPVGRLLVRIRRHARYMTVAPLPTRRLFAFGPHSYGLLLASAGFALAGIRPAVTPHHRSLIRRAASAIFTAVDVVTGHRVQLSPSVVVYGVRGDPDALPRGLRR